jgi:hypothetical protein
MSLRFVEMNLSLKVQYHQKKKNSAKLGIHGSHL